MGCTNVSYRYDLNDLEIVKFKVSHVWNFYISERSRFGAHITIIGSYIGVSPIVLLIWPWVAVKGQIQQEAHGPWRSA